MNNNLDKIHYSIIKLIRHPFFEGKLIPVEYISNSEIDCDAAKNWLDYLIEGGKKKDEIDSQLINYKARLLQVMCYGGKIEDGTNQLYVIAVANEKNG